MYSFTIIRASLIVKKSFRLNVINTGNIRYIIVRKIKALEVRIERVTYFYSNSCLLLCYRNRGLIFGLPLCLKKETVSLEISCNSCFTIPFLFSPIIKKPV